MSCHDKNKRRNYVNRRKRIRKTLRVQHGESNKQSAVSTSESSLSQLPNKETKSSELSSSAKQRFQGHMFSTSGDNDKSSDHKYNNADIVNHKHSVINPNDKVKKWRTSSHNDKLFLQLKAYIFHKTRLQKIENSIA